MKVLCKYKKNWALYFLILYILIGLFIQYYEISQFKSLPSPLYGGDYYYQMGVIHHILFGGNPFKSSSMLNGIPGYLPLYALIVVFFIKIFNLSTIKGLFITSYFLFAISTIIWFFLFKKLIKDDMLSLILSILANPITSYPILKYTHFTHQIMIPLFLLSLYLSFFENLNSKNFIFLGIIYGLLALSHTVAFVGATITLMVFILYKIFFEKNIRNFFKNIFLLLLFGIPVALIYWYKPIFTYHLKSKYDRLHMDIIDFGKLTVKINFLLDTIKSYFFDFSNITASIETILLYLGIYYTIEKRDKTSKFILLITVSSFIATFLYFITEPLFNINFVPPYMSYFYIWTSKILLAAAGLKYIFEILKSKYLLQNNLEIYIKTALVLILTLVNVKNFMDKVKNDRWFKVAKYPLPDIYVKLSKFIINNSKVNDVILSNKELSFVINALTGRKLVTNRWAQQNDPYINLPQRDMEASVILYGNNTKEILKLLKKYNVKYFYWDINWIRLEYQFDKKGRIINIFDPLLTYDTMQNRKYLSSNNVKYIATKFYIDPACRNENVRKFNVLLISFENYRKFYHPWSYNLDKYLIPVWSYNAGGKTLGILFKVKYK